MCKSVTAQCTKQVIGKGLVIIEINCMVSKLEVALLDHESYKSFSIRKSSNRRFFQFLENYCTKMKFLFQNYCSNFSGEQFSTESPQYFV